MSLESQPLVSVVTPFYNTAPYLAECIESVLKQTYGHWDYCLVNNCSDDGSAEIARRYASQDGRIRVVDNVEFLTQVQNYNHALRQISPESRYTKIVQADDWIYPECLERMVAVGEEHPSVGIVSAYRLYGTKVLNRGLPYTTTMMNGREACRFMLSRGAHLFGSPTSILFRSETVRSRDPFYSETSLFEDTEACYEIMQDWDLGFVHQVLTFERVENENESISATARSHDPGWDLDWLITMTNFGRAVFTEEEFAKEKAKAEHAYYWFLADNLIAGRGKEFWDYHTAGLATIGVRLMSPTFLKYVLWSAVDTAGNPKRALGKIVRRFRRDWSG